MRYGLTNKISIHDFASGAEEIIISTPGDFYRAQAWLRNKTYEDTTERENMFIALRFFYAMKRNGKLEGLGISDDATEESVLELLDQVSFFFEEMSAEDAPLALETSKAN